MNVHEAGIDRPARSFPRSLGFVALGILLASAVAYTPVRHATYIWDDDQYVTHNETLRTLAGLRDIWTDAYATPQYYPLVHTSYWLEYRLWQLDPLGYHVDNVLLHALGSLLLVLVLRRLDVPGAALAGFAFALHPVHVESVAWITERKNVLSGVFYFGAILAYLRAVAPAVPSVAPVARRWYYASLALFVAALLSKSVTVTLPVALLLILRWRRGMRLARAEWAPLVPFLAVGGIMAGVTTWLERTHVGAAGAEWQLVWADRCVIASRAIWFYLSKLVWPWPLTFIYPRWDVTFTSGANPLWPLSIVVVAAALWKLRGRWRDGALLIACLFTVTLSPALGFVDFYPMRYSFVADHFQYLASAAPLAGLASLLARWFARSPSEPIRALGAAIVAAWLAVLGGTTWQQAHVYRDAATVWRDTLAKNPAAWIAHLNLGSMDVGAGRVEDATRRFEEVLRLKPDEAIAHSNLSVMRTTAGDFAAAEAHARRAIEIDPALLGARVNLAIALEGQGRVDEAVQEYLAILARHPNYGEAASRLKQLLRRTNQSIVLPPPANP